MQPSRCAKARAFDAGPKMWLQRIRCEEPGMWRTALCLVLLCGLAAEAQKTGETKASFLSETQALRNVAHKSAVASEEDMDALNDAVFPHEAAMHKWHHESSQEMLAKWKGVASSTQGVDPAAKVAYAPDFPPKHARAVVAHTKAQAVRAHAVAHAAAHAQAVVHKPTAAEEAAAEEEAHAALSEAVFPHEGASKWHTESSGEMLSHMAAESAAAMPADRLAGRHMQTAAEMQAEHRREINAAFPRRWAQQERKVQVVGKVDYRKRAIQAKQQQVGAKVWGAKKYRKMDLKSELHHSEQETAAERASAVRAGSAELHHLSKLNDAVWGRAHHKPLNARSKHAFHKALMSHTNAEGAREYHHPHSNKRMPPSSDTEVPAAGTDMVYQGAPQGGYIRKSPSAVAHKAAVSRVD